MSENIKEYPQWVSVEDKYPAEGQEVWFYDGVRVYQGWWMVEAGFHCGNGYIKGVTHWQPFIIPDPPVQPCGHPVSAIVSADEGTSYCKMCAES